MKQLNGSSNPIAVTQYFSLAVTAFATPLLLLDLYRKVSLLLQKQQPHRR